MKNEEYLCKVGNYYRNVMQLRKDSDYVVNQSGMDKLNKIVDFFEETAKELDGNIERPMLIPSQTSGDVTAYFPVFYIHSAKVERFCNLMRECSAISVDSTVDGKVCISCTVPHVYVHGGRK